MNLSCEKVRREALEWGWNRARRQEIAACLAHLDTCGPCQAAVGDYEAFKTAFQDETEPEPADGWEVFEQRLIGQIKPPRRGWPLMPTALAACLVLAALGWGMYFGRERARIVASVPSPAMLANTDVSEGVHLFRQVSSVFDDRASWVLLSNGTSDVGVASEMSHSPDQLLYIRFVLTAGGKALSKAELVIVPGRSADLTLPLPNGDTVKYRLLTSAADPTLVRVSAVVQPPDANESSASLTTRVRARPGQETFVGELQTTAGRLRFDLALQPTPTKGQPI